MWRKLHLFVLAGVLLGCSTPSLYALQDYLRSGKAKAAGHDTAWWLQAKAALQNGAIDLMLRPSAAPGVSGNQGCSPKQLEFAESFWTQSHRHYGASGANRSGKTSIVAAGCFCRWIRDRATDGSRFWVIAGTSETMKGVPQRSIWEYLPRSMFPPGVTYTPKLGFGTIDTLHLNLPGGRGKCEIWFKTQDQQLSTFESDQLDGAWWTECEREALYDAIQPRLVDRRGWLLMDYVPTEAWHRIRIQGGDKSLVHHQRFCMADNAHNLPPNAIAEARLTMSEEQAKVRIDGEDGSAFGVVITEFADRHVLRPGPSLPPVATTEAPWPSWLYIDVGKYTAGLLCTVDPDGKQIVLDEVYTLGLNVEDNAQQMHAMLARHGRTVATLTAAPSMDPAAWSYTAANQVTIGQQYAAAGIPCQPWVRANQVGEPAMIDKVRVEFMHDRLLVAERCVKLIEELQTWRHKTDRDGNVDPKERYVGPNHAIDGLKSWVWTAPTFSVSALNPIAMRPMMTRRR